LESRWDVVEGLKMHSCNGGAGSPVVLVHGYGVSGRYMLPLARRLAGSCTVLVPDLPGHGRSDVPGEPMGIGALAGTVQAWLDLVGLERPAFVGSSMGCQVVTELAKRQPQRVGPIVLLGPTVDPSRRSARRQIFGALRDASREPALLVALTGREWASRNLGQLRALARAVLADRIEERLPAIEQPTLVVHAEQDGLVSRAWAEKVAELLPDGRLVIIPGEAHAVPFSQPGLLAGLITGLLTEEREHAARELIRNLPHRDVPARQPHQLRPWQPALPLLGHARGYQAVTVPPYE
jgi:2-hydroxy-6-oxonona-2,4-dienedioate hydrolase